MKNTKSDKPSISEGMIIALSSVVAYLLAFYYEKGYASVFKIPTSLISINLTSVLIFGAVLINIIIFVLPYANLLLMLTVHRVNPVIQRAINLIIILFLIVMVQIYFFGFSNWKNWSYLLVILVVSLFFQFVFPLISQSGKTYVEKLEAQEETERQFTDSNVLVQNKFGNNTLWIIVFVFAGIYIALSAGMAEAIKQEEFLVTNTTPELVVLRIYGDNIIGVPFNRITGDVEQSFSVIKNTGETGLVLHLEILGQIHLPSKTPPVTTTSTTFPVETLTPTITTP